MCRLMDDFQIQACLTLISKRKVQLENFMTKRDLPSRRQHVPFVREWMAIMEIDTDVELYISYVHRNSIWRQFILLFLINRE
jgi:hypothetical protein